MSETQAPYGNMPCRVIDCEQRSQAWYEAKLGVPSASKIGCIVTPTGKAAANAARRRYALDLAIERITKIPTSVYCTFAMQRGIDLEPLARVWYYTQTGQPVREVGFCLTDWGAGCSPDGLVGDDGCVEIKCPEIAHYCQIIATGEIDDAWLLQMQMQMLVTGRKWCDFVLFTDVKPFSGWIKRIEADYEMHEKIYDALIGFCIEVSEIEDKIIDNLIFAYIAKHFKPSDVVDKDRIKKQMLDFPPPVIAVDEINMAGLEGAEL